jgi:hypothetical protein
MSAPSHHSRALTQALREVADLVRVGESGRGAETFAHSFCRYGSAAMPAAPDCGLRAVVTTGARHWERSSPPV